MVVGKKLSLGCLVMFAIFAIPPFLYGLITNKDEGPSWMVPATLSVAVIFGIGLVIYLAVDAALRHNRDR